MAKLEVPLHTKPELRSSLRRSDREGAKRLPINHDSLRQPRAPFVVALFEPNI